MRSRRRHRIETAGQASLEATVALAGAAAVTERVQVGFSVLVLPLRPFALTAAQIMALQHGSESRVLLGIGIGVSFARTAAV